MEIQSTHSRKLLEKERPCKFSIRPAELLVDIQPNDSLTSHWEYVPSVETGVQCGTEMSAHEVNTENMVVVNRGVNHVEGGWPNDINLEDVEQIARFKKKVEKGEMYLKSVAQLGNLMEPLIQENISLNIYENYFVLDNEDGDGDDDDDDNEVWEESYLRTSHVLWEPERSGRSVSHLCWCPEDPGKLVAAYCSLDFMSTPPESTNSYVWDLEVPITPKATITPDSPLLCVECCPKDMNVLLAGCYNGQIVLWDQRRGCSPVESTPIGCSHMEPVYGVLWVYTKGTTECFSASSDGRVLWWDVRKLTVPTDTLPLNSSSTRGSYKTQFHGSYSATCLEHEPTLPARFMVGTQEGAVLACNRKAKLSTEKITSVYSGHVGPIYALQRNSLAPKVFLTVGDYTAQVWSEEVKESCIISLQSSDDHLTSGCWIPSRPSCLVLGRESGEADVWDLLYSQTKPMLTMKVCDDPLTCMKAQEVSNQVACGSVGGALYLLNLSKDFTTMHKNDKLLITSLLERETQREKVMESRSREQRLHERLRLSGQTSSLASFNNFSFSSLGGGLTDTQLQNLAQNYPELERDFLEAVREAREEMQDLPPDIPEFD